MKKPFKVMSTTALTAAFAAAAVVPVQAEVVDEDETTSFSGIVFDVEGVNTVVSDSDYFNALIDLEEGNENELLDVIVGEDGLIKPPTYVQVGDNFYSASDYVDVVTNNEGSSLDELIQTLTSEKTPLTEEDTEDFVPYEPGDGELVVESVSAITETVFAETADQVLKVEINGEETSVEDLEEAGYTVSFASNKQVFAGEAGAVTTSETGELANNLTVDGTKEFEYQVTVSKDDFTITSELQKVSVISADTFTEITEVELTANGVALNSETVTLNDDNIVIDAVEGTTISGSTEVAVTGETYKSSNETVLLVNSAGEITPVAPGKATITIKAGNATKEVEITVVNEDREATTATADKDSVGTVNGKTTNVKVTVLDQYGDPFVGTVNVPELIQTGTGDDAKTIATVTQNGDLAISAGDKGVLSLDIVADANNTGTANLVVKESANATTNLVAVPITVGSSAVVAERKLELVTGSDNVIDIVNTEDNSIELQYNEYAEGGLFIDPATIGEGQTYTVKVDGKAIGESDVLNVYFDELESANTSGNKLVITGKKAGTATVEIWEGSIKRDSFEVVVENNVPQITEVTFEEDAEITENGEYALSNILKANNIKLSSTEAVGITNTGELFEDKNKDGIKDDNEIKVGELDFVSNVGEVAVAQGTDNQLKLTVDTVDPLNLGTGTIVVQVKDTEGSIVNAETITVDLPTAEEAALQEATDAVEAAELSEAQDDVDSARALVDALPDGDAKDELQTRLDAVQDAIDKAEAKAKYEPLSIYVEEMEGRDYVLSFNAKFADDINVGEEFTSVVVTLLDESGVAIASNTATEEFFTLKAAANGPEQLANRISVAFYENEHTEDWWEFTPVSEADVQAVDSVQITVVDSDGYTHTYTGTANLLAE